MKWWCWLILEILIILGVMSWVYFFPGEIEDNLSRGIIGFVFIFSIEETRKILRRNK